MKKPTHTRSATRLPRVLLAGLLAALWGGLGLGMVPSTAQAQISGALPLYRCVGADGTSSRMSRTPCAASETGSAQHAVAGAAQHKPAIVHQGPSATMQQQAQDEARQRRPQASGRSGRMGRRR